MQKTYVLLYSNRLLRENQRLDLQWQSYYAKTYVLFYSNRLLRENLRLDLQ